MVCVSNDGVECGLEEKEEERTYADLFDSYFCSVDVRDGFVDLGELSLSQQLSYRVSRHRYTPSRHCEQPTCVRKFVSSASSSADQATSVRSGAMSKVMSESDERK